MLTEPQALDLFADMKTIRDGEQTRLELIRSYLRDDPHRRLRGLPTNAPQEIHRLARLARVNMLKFIVNSRVESMFVDGYRAPRAGDDHPAWGVWQANGMDARQIGVNRAALAYGASFVTVLPGDPVPVMRGASPRQMTVAYGVDDQWPQYALELRRATSGHLWRLFDDEHVYWISEDKDKRRTVEQVDVHGAGVVPVVRVRDTDDLDDPVTGIVEPFMPLQDQINITTFGLLVAQHYTAFKQRWVVGWLAEDEDTAIKTAADRFVMFEDSDVTVGEWSETNLDGYIKSRESTLKHLATVSQTPAHELIGEMVNISADALVAAEASKRRAIVANQTVMGESYEQALALAGAYLGEETDPMAYVRWRDTEARSLAQLVDALGKAVTMLGIPPQELWPRVADAMGVSEQELEQWKATAESADAFAGLQALMEAQAQPAVL